MYFALTGGFGGGKSTVRGFFEQLGWKTFSADAICHGFFPELEPAAMNRWGEKVFTAGKIDHKKLAEVIFQNPEELKFWSSLLYPRLGEKMKRLKKESAGKKYLIEIPLLYENNLENNFDGVISVYTGDASRHARLMEQRGFDADEIKRREKLQLPPEIKLEKSDFALINNGNLENIYAQVSELDRRLTSERMD